MGSSRLLTTVELRQITCKDLTTTTTSIYLSASITNTTTSKRLHHHRTQIATNTSKRRSFEFTEEIRFLLSHTHQEITVNTFYLEIELCSPAIFSKDKVIGKVTVPVKDLLQQSPQGILNYQITSVKKKKQRGILTFFFKITNDSPQRVDPIPQPTPITPPASVPETKPTRVSSGLYPSVDFSREKLYGPIPPPSPVPDPHNVPPPLIIPPDPNCGYCSPQVLPFHPPPSPAYYGGLTPPRDYGFCGTPVHQPPPSPAYYNGSSTPTSRYYGDNCYYSHRGY